MTWIIIGDSWSSTEINQLSTREFYPFEHSLFQHMRSRYGRDVHCFAEPGHSDLAQLRRLEAGLQGWSEPVRVLRDGLIGPEALDLTTFATDSTQAPTMMQMLIATDG